MTAQPLHDVAVVGLGPVGATLANLLALRGLRVVVVEREEDIFPLPRAIQFDGEVMRVFQTIGIAEELLPDLVVAARMVFVDDEGHTLIDWRRPTDVMPQGWNTSYRFHQPTLERLLRARLEASDLVTLQFGQEVTALHERDDHVAVEVFAPASGTTGVLAARYVVGADGARSTVRRHLGTTLDDLRSHERWLVVDCLLDAEKPTLGEDSIQYCDPRRPATYVRGPHHRRRWELMLHDDEDAEAMVAPQRVWELLAPWLAPHEATIERPAVYTFHSVVARGWARGRVFLAGDACHQTPPFMGQGMCAGIRDAANLAWKLAEVIEGRAGTGLLASYEAERSPHVRTFIETAVRLGSVISTTDPAEAAARNARMRAAPEAFRTPAPRLGDGAWDAADEEAGFIGEQPFMADGTRLDDLVGYDWAIVATPEAAAALPDATPGVTVVAVDSSSGRAWLGRLAAAAVLVRPDRYVAARASTPDDVGCLLARPGVWAPGA